MLKSLMVKSGLLVAFVAGAHASASAQRIDPNLVIDLHVNAEAENRAFDGSVMEGRRFRLTFRGNATYEISPVRVSAQDRTFRLTIYKGPEGAATEALRVVEQLEVRQGVPAVIPSMPTVSIVVDGTRTAQAAAGASQAVYRTASMRTPAPQALTSRLLGECCITCGTITACGCAVGMSCGSCCSDACCKPIDHDHAAALNLRARSFAQLIGRCGKQVKDSERILTPRVARTVIASR